MYPQSTFEALFVKTVNGRDYLKELVDALFIVEVSKLLKGLLDLLPKSLRLMGMTGAKGKKNGKDRLKCSETMLVQYQEAHKTPVTSNNRRV